MVIQISLEIVLIVSAVLLIIVVVFFALQIYNTRTIRRLTTPMYERIRTQANQEARSIVADAHQQAAAILEAASVDGEQLTAIYEKNIAGADRIISDAQAQAQALLAGVSDDRERLTAVYEAQIEQAKDIVADAQEQANAIIISAKDQRSQMVDDYSQQITKLQHVYEQKLAEHIGSLTEHIDELRSSQTKELTDASAELFESIILEHGKIRKRFDKVLTMFETTQQSMVSESEEAVKSVKDRLAQTAETLTNQLQNYDNTIKETISEHIKHTYEVIDTQMDVYREARQAILDRHIQQIVEDVANRLLHKQLTVIEHAELVRDALAEAKKDNLL